MRSAPSDLDPARSGEADKRRSAVIVSNDGANVRCPARPGRDHGDPLTANVQRVYPFQVLVAAAHTGLDRDSKAQAGEIRSVSIDRILETLGRVPPELMLEIDEALRLHLSL